MKLYLK
jgi:acetyl esterase/lipase